MPHSPPGLEVICGSMFSGKSEELIRRVHRAQYARQKVQVFKPSADRRPLPLAVQAHLPDSPSPATKVASHAGQITAATPVADPDDLLAQVNPDTDLVAIDEVQFFPLGIVATCQYLVDAGHQVIVAGLDLDFRAVPFPVMAQLLAEAESITKLQAICTVCAEPASRSQRLIDGHPAHYDDPVFMLGAAETYQARCRRCHQVPGRPTSA